MYDRIDHLKDTVFQHGPFNDRIYIMQTAPEDHAELLPYIEKLATRRGYGKVIAKVPASARRAFAAWGAAEEGRVPDYYGADQDAHFMARYFDSRRRKEHQSDLVRKNLAIARAKATENPSPPDGGGWNHTVSIAVAADAEALSRIYRRVFPTYPFPIHDPEYLRQAMQRDVVYFKLEHDHCISAVASAEMDLANGAVEMTDFATLPELRGQGAAQSLLLAMETAMRQRGLRLAFTIARACSAGMNVTFAKCRYAFGGTLRNNTNISGRIESMNLWFRPLAHPAATS